MTYPINRYLNIRNAYQPVFSADGRFLSFISNITGRAQVWQVALTGITKTISWPTQLTFAADRVLSLQASPIVGDQRLIFTHDLGGNENAQIFLLDPVTGQESCLTSGYETAMHIPGAWSQDGHYLLFAANRRHRGQFDLYRLSLLDGTIDLLWQHEAPGYLFQATFAPDGHRAAVICAAHTSAQEVWEIDLDSGGTQMLSNSNQPARYTDILYDGDGRSLLVNTDLGSDFLHIARINLATRITAPVIEAAWDTEMPTLASNGRHLAYTINSNGRSQLMVQDLGNGRCHSAPQINDLPGVIGWFDEQLAFSTDGKRLAFSHTNPTTTSDIYIWDIANDPDNFTQCTRSSHGGIPPNTFNAPQLIHYPTFDERHIPAWFYPPAPTTANKQTNYPTIIMVHGGPEGQTKAAFNFLAQYFVHNGYAVLAPNVRGSTGYGKTYSQLDDVEKRMDSVADLAHAAHWLKTQPNSDPQRIVVYGGSYGGFMVLSALTTYPTLWAAGINIVGISNFVTFLENTSDYRRGHRESEYGTLANDRQFLESIAPINHLDKIKAPLMVIHGANDPRVPLSEAEQLVTALEQRNIPVEFLTFADEGHGIAKLKNKQRLYPAIVKFLNEVLQTTI